MNVSVEVTIKSFVLDTLYAFDLHLSRWSSNECIQIPSTAKKSFLFRGYRFHHLSPCLGGERPSSYPLIFLVNDYRKIYPAAFCLLLNAFWSRTLYGKNNTKDLSEKIFCVSNHTCNSACVDLYITGASGKFWTTPKCLGPLGRARKWCLETQTTLSLCLRG